MRGREACVGEHLEFEANVEFIVVVRCFHFNSYFIHLNLLFFRRAQSILQHYLFYPQRRSTHSPPQPSDTTGDGEGVLLNLEMLPLRLPTTFSITTNPSNVNDTKSHTTIIY
jgi:hypothetical protein